MKNRFKLWLALQILSLSVLIDPDRTLIKMVEMYERELADHNDTCSCDGSCGDDCKCKG